MRRSALRVLSIFLLAPASVSAQQEAAIEPAQQAAVGDYRNVCRADASLKSTAGRRFVEAPTNKEVEALALLEEQAALYQRSAEAFELRLNSVVKHHYELRRKNVLFAIDQELELQKQSLVDARKEAIASLESFIQRYSGPNADPEATPDAMLRLAALYEEKARADYDSELRDTLKPAIALYQEVISQFPAYSESAAAYYYLGHALLDSIRMEEAQQAFRSLVCANHFQMRSAGDGRFEVRPLAQDHSPEFWEDWYTKNSIPFDRQTGRRASKGAGVAQEELEFRDPYSGCEAIVQKTESGEEPRYLAEVWWQIGNYHFEQMNPSSGPYALNRAVSAYNHSLQYQKPPLYGVALYKQAWAYFKQQRYEAAVDYFVRLLNYADEEEKRTGDKGADFRSEAYTYIAGSLTYLDMKGPPEKDPYIPRSDVLDVEPDPLVAEEKMAIALKRVSDPALVPQDRAWTVGVYKALAKEFVDLAQPRNAVAALELTVERFPLDRDAPLLVAQRADLLDELARNSPPESEMQKEYSSRALAARTQLARYVGKSAWTDHHQKDKEALAQAEKLASTGVQRAAADHTNFARAHKENAERLSEGAEKKVQLEKAIEEYGQAATAWAAHIAQDPKGPEVYEASFWLADALYWTASLQVALGRMPSQAEIDAAYQWAAKVRDSHLNDKYRQPAAFFAVSLSERILDAEAIAFEQSGGAQGIERREEVSFVGSTSGERQVRREQVPAPVLAAVCARDEYNSVIPLDESPELVGVKYATQAAEYFFIYGQFAEARRRLMPIYKAYCGKNEWGYNAWEKLISMSNFEGNASLSRLLANAPSCAFNEETKQAENAIRAPVKIGVVFMEAATLFKKALQLEEGEQRDKTWRAAAAAYQAALKVAPERQEAPEAVMNGAYAYKQVGAYDQAIAMYRLFIESYGKPELLEKLKSQDVDQYSERITYLNDAYQALAGAYVLFFDYPLAAKTLTAITQVKDFDIAERKQVAKQALLLYVNLDDKKGMSAMRDTYLSLEATAEEAAEAEFLFASASLKRWDVNSPDQGANQDARLTAQRAMTNYYEANRQRPAAAQFVVQAAYRVAQAKRASKHFSEDDWWKKTIQAYDFYVAGRAPDSAASTSAGGSLEANMAAEADYRLVDESLKKQFDYESGHHHYSGTIVEVLKKYASDAQEAKKWYDRLQVIVDKYVSQKWATIAIARQGSVYDSLRTGLYNARPPELKMFTPQQERALRIAEQSDNMDLQDKADQIRFEVNEAWRSKRDQELDSADRIVVDRYSASVMLAQRYNLSDESISKSIRRLAFLTDVAGEAKMAEYVAANRDLKYRAGMFQQMRPGMSTISPGNALPLPSPPAAGAQ